MRKSRSAGVFGVDKRLGELHNIQRLQVRPLWMNMLHPLGKLLVSVLFIVITVSFPKYELVGLLVMGVYLIFGFVVGELSVVSGLYRMRLILPLVAFVGILNPFFDRTPGFLLFGFTVTGGVISMLTLMIKGIFAVLSAYILIATTSVGDICYALSTIRVPKLIVIVVLLIDRYFVVMAEEADKITTAYALRAPQERGIRYSAWGTLVGQWLLRSMDRAGAVYESMLLRGFTGDFNMEKRGLRAGDVLYPLVWGAAFILIRYTPAVRLLGEMFL